MWLDRVVKFLLPREDHFFDLLERGAACALESSELLLACCSAQTRSEREAMVERMGEIEHKADVVIKDMYDSLNRTFVTPLDRSDIYELATSLENIPDLVQEAVSHVVIHAMEDIPNGSVELATNIHQACQEIVAGVERLRRSREYDQIPQHCHRINQLESAGDAAFRNAIVHLFKEETDAIRLLKHKEFLEEIEETLDECDNVGNVLTAIVIKNA